MVKEDLSPIEEAYADWLSEPLREAERIGGADIAVGLIFKKEARAVGHACRAAAKGLSDSFPDKKCVLVCVGVKGGQLCHDVALEAPTGRAAEIIAVPAKHGFLSGRHWSLRAAMEIADNLAADLAVLEADLGATPVGNGTEGRAPNWVGHVLLPIEQEGIDLVISKVNGCFFGRPAATHLVRPLLASLFGRNMGGLPRGAFGVSAKLLRIYVTDLGVTDLGTWEEEIGEHGVDSWLATTALVNAAAICETSISAKGNGGCPDEDKIVRQQVKAIFEQTDANKDWWQQEGDMVHPLATFGQRESRLTVEVAPDPGALIERYKNAFNEYQGLYGEILSRDAAGELRKLAGREPDEFRFPSRLWAEIAHDFLLTYCLGQLSKSDVLDAFIPICYAREAGFVLEIEALRKRVEDALPDRAERLTALAAEWEVRQQIEEFVNRRRGFAERWRKEEEALKPILPRVTYREFIPGVPLIVPKEFVSPAGETVGSDRIYDTIVTRYRKEFEDFVYERLGVPRQATPDVIAHRVKELMRQLENDLTGLLLEGDLSTVEGTGSIARAVFDNFPHSEAFALKPEVASWILRRNPPANSLIKLGAASLAELERSYEPNAVLALSSLLEETGHTARVWEWIAGNARPEHFTRFALEPVVVSCEDFPMLTHVREPSALSKLAGRIVVSNLPERAGGELPKLRYFTTMAKNIVEAEAFGQIWGQFARERKEFGTRVVNSLRGHWGRDPLSAHNIFESRLQRILIERLREMATDVAGTGDPALLRMSESLRRMIECYHLASSFPDGSFIPCSAWTWSSYSFKGGTGSPTPLSLHVERDWASREFLLELYTSMEGTEESMDRRITELMGQGMESENLARLILPGWQPVDDVMPEQLPLPAEPQAGKVTRFAGNPILEALSHHEWESSYVFNPGAIRLKDKVYLVYRACGEDEVSRLGLAATSDGLQIDERLESPIFWPEAGWETRGCEDPRLVIVGERIYMLYTGYDSVTAQIAMASISVDDFVSRRWDRWTRHGLAFPGFDDKDATLFPETFDGRYVMYHRIEPSIWISSSDRLECPWSREDHRILLGPGSVGSWDGLKIGGGSQPIRTKHGWLLIYHGVDHRWFYRLGVMLVSLDDPGRLLYRSPNPILEPEESYELGEAGCYVPNVVFTCGAVPRADKMMLDDDDEVLVYYGAADTAICVATARVADLIPEEIRQGRNNGSLPA
jgi:predicted GH43/DUF377 family glycosyl hydrolase